MAQSHDCVVIRFVVDSYCQSLCFAVLRSFSDSLDDRRIFTQEASYLENVNRRLPLKDYSSRPPGSQHGIGWWTFVWDVARNKEYPLYLAPNSRLQTECEVGFNAARRNQEQCQKG